MIEKRVNPITEVRRNRELLLAKYGGITGLHNHMEKEKLNLEKQGWRFISVQETRSKKHECS